MYKNVIYSVKELVPNFLDKEKYVLHCKNLQRYQRIGFKQKRITRCIRIQSLTMAKPLRSI